MVYACRSNRPIATTKDITVNHGLSEEAKKIHKFIESHKISVYVDSETGVAKVEIEKNFMKEQQD